MAEETFKNNLVIIEDSVLLNMAADERFVRELPFLRGLKTSPRTGCRRCGGQDSRIARNSLNAAKQVIHTLPADRKQIIKRLLNARQARVVYRRPTGQVVSVTF